MVCDVMCDVCECTSCFQPTPNLRNYGAPLFMKDEVPGAAVLSPKNYVIIIMYTIPILLHEEHDQHPTSTTN